MSDFIRHLRCSACRDTTAHVWRRALRRWTCQQCGRTRRGMTR